jgi:hypothetical protein
MTLRNQDYVGGFHIKEIGGNLTMEAAGDIVGGDKKVIQHIHNVYELRITSRPISQLPYKFLERVSKIGSASDKVLIREAG